MSEQSGNIEEVIGMVWETLFVLSSGDPSFLKAEKYQLQRSTSRP